MFDVEACACVANFELNAGWCGRERNCELIFTAVFDSVVKGFLRDAEETKGDVVGQVIRYVAFGEVDRYSVAPREFLAECANGSGEAEVVQYRGVELVGE